MDLQKQNSNLSKDSDEFADNCISSSPTNSNSLNFNNLGTCQSVIKHSGLNQSASDPSKYSNCKPMLDDQKFAMMDLKLSEYEKALADKNHTIKSIHTQLMNSQNENHVLTNQCMNIVEKTKPLSDTYVYQNSGLANICDRLNKLGNSVDNARTIQKDVMNLVDQTTKIFQEKLLNIDESLKQVSLEKMSAQQEIETLENKCSLDMIVYKSNLEECTKENEILKTENYWLLEKLNQTNIRLNEEKEMAFNFIQNYEKVLKEMEGQNVFLISQNESFNAKYGEILSENQSLKDEVINLKISLDENKDQLDVQLKAIKEQSQLLYNLKISEELNDTLKKDNLSLKEDNKYLEKKHASFVEDFNKLKLSHKEILEEKERKFEDMCKKYDNLLKMQEEIFVEKTRKLQLQNDKECEIQTKETDLKQVVDECNNTIFNLQEEIKNYHTLIPGLQNKIVDLSTNLTNANQKLQNFNQENIIKMNNLKKEKSLLENQHKEYFKQIHNLTADHVKYKSEIKQLYAKVRKLRFQCSQTNQKNAHKLPTVETIELLSDEDVNTEDDDCSIVEFNDKVITNMDVSIKSASNKINHNYNYASFKRNASPLRQISNSKVKICKISVDNISSQILTKSLKQKIDVNQMKNSLNSSFKCINLIHEDKNINEMKGSKQFNQDLRTEESKTLLKEKCNVDNESKNQVLKKIFKKSANKPSQKKSKPLNIQNINSSKPNSIFLIPAKNQNSQS